MKSKYLLLAMFVLLLLTTPVNSFPGLPFNPLVVGEIELKRPSWLNYQLVRPFQQLNLDDWVRAKSPNSIVLCGGIRMRTIPQQTTSVSELCPQTEPTPIRYGESLVGRPRGGTNPLIPYIISPRKTWLLGNKPLIRWNAVPNATRYIVRLLEASKTIWQIEVTQTEIAYPGNPPLRPTVPYALVVQADTGTSSVDEGIPGLGFQIISSAKAQEIAEKVKQLSKNDLSKEAQALILARFYNSEGLTIDAIQVLQSFIANGGRHVAVYHLLGELFRQVRLNLNAKDSYLLAVELAKTEGDVETLAEIQLDLGNVYIVLNDRTAAVESLKQAKSAYISLEGDRSARVKKIAEQLATLNP